MISYKYVDEFIQQWRDGKITLNKRRIKLIELIEREIYPAADMYFDAEQIESYIAFTEKYYFPLTLAQKFKTCFIFLYYTDGSLVFNEHLDYEGRGGGKTGRISSLANYFIGPLHNIPYYNVSVVANSEKQAKMSFTEVYNTIDQDDALRQYFDHKKALIESYDTKSVFQYHTSNANTKDGLRDGAVIFEEIHQYEDAATVNVFTSGLGKVKNPRIFYVGSDGYVRDGFMDKLNERADNILDGHVSIREDGLFPFMCCLDDESEMHNPDMWQKANSQFHPPLSEYAKTLFKTVTQQYKKLDHDSSGYEEFITKRMNLPKIDMEKNVTSWEKIEATNQNYDLEALKNRECIGSVDYASIRDFVAVGLLFFANNKYIIPRELFQEFVCKPFADKHYGYSQQKAEGNNKKDHRKFAPIREWENDGLLTVLDKEAMDPFIVVQWFTDRRKEGWNIKKVIGDSFRMEILRPLLEAEGFEVEVIRNPDAASALLAPKIELAFDEERVIFGDNPIMRWNTNNVLVIVDNRGNKLYRKKEKTKRKTDGFMMFLYAVWASRDLEDVDISASLDFLSALNF